MKFMILIFFFSKNLLPTFFLLRINILKSFSTLLLQKIFGGASAFAQTTLNQTASSMFLKISHLT
jgi:hypothetical protein